MSQVCHLLKEIIKPITRGVSICCHIIVSFSSFLSQKGFIGEIHQWELHCGKECLSIGIYQLNGLRGMSSPFCRYPPILPSQEQLALRELTLLAPQGLCHQLIVSFQVERFTGSKRVFLLVDVEWMGYEGWATHSVAIHQSLNPKNSWRSGA